MTVHRHVYTFLQPEICRYGDRRPAMSLWPTNNKRDQTDQRKREREREREIKSEPQKLGSYVAELKHVLFAIHMRTNNQRVEVVKKVIYTYLRFKCFQDLLGSLSNGVFFPMRFDKNWGGWLVPSTGRSWAQQMPGKPNTRSSKLRNSFGEDGGRRRRQKTSIKTGRECDAISESGAWGW